MAWKSGLARAVAGVLVLMLGACATEPTPAEKVAAPYAAHSGSRITVTLGDFVYNPPSAKAAPAPEETARLAAQARDILKAQLQESQRFLVRERGAQPAPSKPRPYGREFRLVSNEYQITGDIADVGQREAGEPKTLGVFGGGKSLVAFAGVTVYVVNVQTKEGVFGARGYSEQEVGPGGVDAALRMRLLEQAIREAVKEIIEGKDRTRWGQEIR